MKDQYSVIDTLNSIARANRWNKIQISGLPSSKFKKITSYILKKKTKQKFQI